MAGAVAATAGPIGTELGLGWPLNVKGPVIMSESDEVAAERIGFGPGIRSKRIGIGDEIR